MPNIQSFVRQLVCCQTCPSQNRTLSYCMLNKTRGWSI